MSTSSRNSVKLLHRLGSCYIAMLGTAAYDLVCTLCSKKGTEADRDDSCTTEAFSSLAIFDSTSFFATISCLHSFLRHVVFFANAPRLLLAMEEMVRSEELHGDTTAAFRIQAIKDCEQFTVMDSSEVSK